MEKLVRMYTTLKRVLKNMKFSKKIQVYMKYHENLKTNSF